MQINFMDGITITVNDDILTCWEQRENFITLHLQQDGAISRQIDIDMENKTINTLDIVDL